MATLITINGTMTLDESLGLQNTGIPVPGEDNNDSDVAFSTASGSPYDTRVRAAVALLLSWQPFQEQ